jgi:hypothetical protein
MRGRRRRVFAIESGVAFRHCQGMGRTERVRLLSVTAYSTEAVGFAAHDGGAVRIRGYVESIAGGIEDRERTDAAGALANVNPTFTWCASRNACRCGLRSTSCRTASA